MSSPNIHKRQLFHWIGKHVDPRLPQAGRIPMYLDALRGSLTDGLWLSRMSEEIRLLRRTPYPLSRRMVCFTENRLSDCRYHAGSYGRLGLGFSKYFVLKAGGKPVSYVRHKTGDLYTLRLLEALEAASGTPAAEPLDFIAHFVKPLYAEGGRSTSGEGSKKGTPVPRGAPAAKVERRQFGPRMRYHAEAEWRMVEDHDLLKRKSAAFRSDTDRTYLSYEPGHDLMTIVFPDRATQQAAMADPMIGGKLAGAKVPVNVYHLDEISEL